MMRALEGYILFASYLFFEEVFHDLTGQQQHAFIRLLEQEDPDLIQWFSLKGQAGNSEMQAMVDMILERVQPTPYL